MKRALAVVFLTALGCDAVFGGPLNDDPRCRPPRPQYCTPSPDDPVTLGSFDLGDAGLVSTDGGMPPDADAGDPDAGGDGGGS